MSDLFSVQGILALLLGGLYGSIFGAIPGLTATLAVALFIPIAFFLDPSVALPAIIAISSVAIFAGDVGSTVAKIPGTPASAAYFGQLFRLSRKEGPLYSLGISAIGSAIGGVIGALLLILTASLIVMVARQFSSFEYFWIAVLGLMAGVFASGGSALKSFASLLLGLLFATVGVDPTLGFPRFHFGNAQLMGGLNYIVAMIGLFGFSEVLGHVFRPEKNFEAELEAERSARAFFMRPMLLILQKKWLVIRSSLVGVMVGFLPGAGADIGSWVSSSIEKIKSKGKGDAEHDDEIILAGTSSNNAAVASAWIPALSLGLPGDTITAIVLGIFMMKGISPGPLLFDQQPELITSLYLTFIISNVILLPCFGYLSALMAKKLIKTPMPLLLSVVTALCIVGAYAINNDVFDVWIMAGMGLLAFLLKRGGFPLAQVVLGMVLGPILEQNFMVSAIKSRWDMSSFFDRPVALILMAATILIIYLGVKYSGKMFKQPDTEID
ncbi:MAG: tripartite tricarboxylate transporter permease [Saprospiraceae bacterium]|nr:tripartite tricarboxylate transporter permease [Saprospiraceae bacterium]